MIKQLLVGLDGSRQNTENSVRYACDLAKIHKAKILGLAVVDSADIESSYNTPKPIGAGSSDKEWYDKSIKEAEEAADNALAVLSRIAEDAGVDHKGMKVEGDPSEEILKSAALADMVIIPEHTRFTCGISEDSFCDATMSILEKSVRPLILVPDEYREVKQVMIALDFQRLSDSIFFQYVHLNPYPGAKVHLVHVSNKKDIEIPEELVEYFKIHDIEVITKILSGDHTGQALVNYVKTEDIDMVVMGIHSVSKLWSVLLGSTGRYVLDNLDVLTYTMT